MPTVTLRVKGDSLKKLFELLDQIPEVEVIENDINFQSTKSYLNSAFQGIVSGDNRIVTPKELENKMEEIISRHES
jgi:hypothetical protein